MANFALGVILTSIAFAFAAFVGIVNIPRISARLFPTRIDHTVGSVKLSNSGSALNSIDVHVLGNVRPPEWIGLTIQNIGFAQPESITPVTLSVAEARRLSELLAQAAT